MEIGYVKEIDINQEMQQSYLDYAMSVIVSRALPDARDGLKPVQRRILYAMYDMGIRPNSTYKKSARIVGEVLGKYHPHGDMAVYETMARMAQEFSLRYPLIDGQGNFGSIDGDPPAAMRYTEARILPLALELLSQINMDTVNFSLNFDQSLVEPDVLPASIPNLLVNGSSGIAVGLATNVPPHNLGEVIDALVFLLNNWKKIDDIAVTDIMEFIKGPDFPTGGIIIQDNIENDLLSIYGSGRGSIQVRGRVHIEQMSRGRQRIVINELPYQVNKSSFIEKIADLVRNGVLNGISDLRDESDRQGMRIAIELSKNANIEEILIDLYKKTMLQTSFRIAMFALVKDEPRLLSLKQALKVYLDHRLEVIKRRSEYELNKAKDRAHILEGLRIAISFLDEVIAIIRNSTTVEKAKAKLRKQLKLSDVQAQAILDMPLKRISALERKKIESEYKELVKRIKELESLLKSPQKMRVVIQQELIEQKEKFNNSRRTDIVDITKNKSKKQLLTASDIIDDRIIWGGITQQDVIGKTKEDTLKRVTGRSAPILLVRTSTRHIVYLVDDQGITNAININSLPDTDKFSEGINLSSVIGNIEGRNFIGMFSSPAHQDIPDPEELTIITVSKMGMVKRSSLSDLPGLVTDKFVLSKVNEKDKLIWTGISSPDADLLLLTSNGMAIRFPVSDVRSMGLLAAGVGGIKLKSDDRVVSADIITKQKEITVIAEDGNGWRFSLNEIPKQGRYGQGVIISKLTSGESIVGMVVGKPSQSVLVHHKKLASKTIRLDAINISKRMRSSQQLIDIKAGDAISKITQFTDNIKLFT